MVIPEEREGKSNEASGVLARDSRLAKEDAISTRKGGQHQKEKHQVNVICIHYVYITNTLPYAQVCDAFIPCTL